MEGEGGPPAAVISPHQRGSQQELWRSRAAGRVKLLGFGQESQRRIWTLDQSVDMFDKSHYPFNCFNYDGDGYSSCSTEEEKKMCRPAYR